MDGEELVFFLGLGIMQEIVQHCNLVDKDMVCHHNEADVLEWRRSILLVVFAAVSRNFLETELMQLQSSDLKGDVTLRKRLLRYLWLVSVVVLNADSHLVWF